MLQRYGYGMQGWSAISWFVLNYIGILKMFAAVPTRLSGFVYAFCVRMICMRNGENKNDI